MRISVTTESDIYPLEISDDLELENFKALCEMEVGIPASEMVVTFNARPMTDDKKPLKDYGIKDGDLVLVVRGNELLRRAAAQLQRQQQQQRSHPMDISQFDFGAIQLPGGGGSGSVNADTQMATERPLPSTAGSGQVAEEQDQESREGSGEGGLGALEGTSEDDPGVIRDMLLANPEQLALLRHNNPRLAEALTSGDLERFATVLREQQDARRDREQQRIRLLTADPFDMEAQRMIANEIQQENINANMEAAMEYNPESFGTVCMLYINCKVNGHDVKAFIDSGSKMEFSEESPQKVRTLDTNLSCIICKKSLDEASGGKAVSNPTPQEIQTLIIAAQKWKAEVYVQILPYIEDPEGTCIKVAFYNNCQASYTSKCNLESHLRGSISEGTHAGEGTSKRPKRSETSNFNIRRD